MTEPATTKDPSQTACTGCGGCCSEGGPALHDRDLALLRTGSIPLTALITLRKGELVHHPLRPSLTPTKVELVKLKGLGATWTCLYFDQGQKRCSIYAHRPEACRTLQCWKPAELIAMIEKDVVSRLDILGPDHPVAPWIIEHEQLCPIPALQELKPAGHCSAGRREELLQLVRRDIQFRQRAVAELDLQLSEELFYFGRPVFQLLSPFGIGIAETASGIVLRWP